METIRWIRLDIPYQDDGNKMRAVVGHSADGGRLSTIVSDYSDNIPNILEVLKASFAAANLESNSSAVLVYPLDGRMNLAWVVKEAADKEKWEFDRHIPAAFYPGVEVLCGFELDETGSEEEPAKEPAQATEQSSARRISILGFACGHVLFAPSFATLRQAFWLVFSWSRLQPDQLRSRDAWHWQ